MIDRCSFRLTRILVSLSATALAGVMQAQGERGSLTEEFPNMSPKERSRIAAKEVEEAQKDASYQVTMQQAEKLFQEGRYEEALKSYEQARIMRPYNVYPKVKIEDLRALLAKQAAPVDSSSIVVEQHPVEVEPVAQPEPEPVHAIKVEPEPMVTKSEIPEVKATVVVPPPAPDPATLTKADGVIERHYREGHAFVIERVVSVDGRSVTYKRVFHQYGQVFYFEDGLAVDERVWKARFPDR